MKTQFGKITLAATLGLAITIFLSCSDYPPLRFPSEEDMLSRAMLFSSSSEPSSSSVASSSSSAGSSSSGEPSSSSGVPNGSSSSSDGSSSSAGSSSSSEPSSSSVVLEYCGEVEYNPATQFCYSDGKVGNFCGINPQKSYDPDLYECHSGSNGIYLKGGLTDNRDGGKYYNAVLIGTQVWMAENLNYAVNGSRCNKGGDSDCDKYGRLYEWGQGNVACPSNWHLPSKDDWNTLMQFVNPNTIPDRCTASKCSNAGKLLKATSGWDDYYGINNGTDDYGFAALPGGSANKTTGSPGGVGTSGIWWSAQRINNNLAFYWLMSFNSEDALNGNNQDNTQLNSVRCVKD